MESSLPKHHAQTWEIVVERIQHAEPVAPAVDFQSFGGAQAIVRLDEPGVRFRSDSIGAGERLQNRIRHASLYVQKRHSADRVGAWMYFSALRASECTSSQEGILSG